MKIVPIAAAHCTVFLLCLPVAATFAQVGKGSPPGSNSAAVISKAEMAVLGRGTGGQSMYVSHVLSYCVRGSSLSSVGNRGLQVRFESKKLTTNLLEADALVKGSIVSPQEPLDGKNERCSTIEFAVHADALVGLELMSESSNPRLILEAGDGSILSSQPVRRTRP